MYRYKIYFKDSTSKISNCRAKKPTSLFHDFDGLIDYNEYYSLTSENTSIKKTLELAFKCYKKLYKKEYYRIEIINDETMELIDFIEEK